MVCFDGQTNEIIRFSVSITKLITMKTDAELQAIGEKIVEKFVRFMTLKFQ